MLKIPVTPEDIENAKKRVEKTTVNNAYSILMDIELRNFIGVIGELVFEKAYPKTIAFYSSSREFDFLLGNQKIDVKTRISKYAPLPYWDCRIPVYTVKKKSICDSYVFCVYDSEHTMGYLVGWISKKELIQKAQIKSAKEVLKKERNIIPVDFYVVQIEQLNPMQTLK